MKTIQKTTFQGNLFDQQVRINRELFDFHCLIDKDCWEDFFKEYSAFSRDIKKYDIGPFFQIECKTESLYMAGKEKDKYFMRDRKFLTK